MEMRLKEKLTVRDVDKMILQGYRRVSNKFKTVARIDKVDWIEHLYTEVFIHKADSMKEAVLDFYEGKDIMGFRYSTILAEAGSAADYYRRCLSKDTIIIDNRELFKLFPISNDSSIGYIEKEEE